MELQAYLKRFSDLTERVKDFQVDDFFRVILQTNGFIDNNLGIPFTRN